MARHVAFLRAINVGGHTVTMDRLRGLFAGLGLDEVDTFIASGNVIFTSPGKGLPALERRIEAKLEASLGYEVATFIRTAAEVVAIAAYKPFPAAQIRDARAFCVGFVARPLDASARRSLQGLANTIDRFHVHDREVYWLCANQQSESKFSNAVFEKATGVKVTFRGAATVAKLAAKLEARA